MGCILLLPEQWPTWSSCLALGLGGLTTSMYPLNIAPSRRISVWVNPRRAKCYPSAT